MLINAVDGLSLPQLMEWLNHTSPRATLHYYRVRPTKLARAFAKADETAHMITVLVDHRAVADGAAGKYYDLGAGFCSNPFWSTCRHRMACAGCDFYVPKASSEGQALEARESLGGYLEAVPLTAEERSIAEGDLAKLDGLLSRLREVATPDGRTPVEIAAASGA